MLKPGAHRSDKRRVHLMLPRGSASRWSNKEILL